MSLSEPKTKEEKMIDVYDGGMNAFVADFPEDSTKRTSVGLKAQDVVYDSVHKPLHYQSKDGSIEVIQIIEQFDLNYRLGNVCKYILRANNKHKTPKEDNFKALWYLCREIKSQGYERDLKEFFEKQLKEIK